MIQLKQDWHGFSFKDPQDPLRSFAIYVGPLPNRKQPAVYLELRFPPGACRECEGKGYKDFVRQDGLPWKKTCYACFGAGAFPNGSARTMPVAFMDTPQRAAQVLAVLDFLASMVSGDVDRERFITFYEQLAAADGYPAR